MSAVLNAIGAPRPMKMGTIAAPWRYDAVALRRGPDPSGGRLRSDLGTVCAATLPSHTAGRGVKRYERASQRLDHKIELVRRQLSLGDAEERDVVDARMDHRVGARIGVIKHLLDRAKAQAPQIQHIVRGCGRGATDLEVGYDVLAEARAENESIVAAATGQRIVAGATDDRIVAVAGADGVATGTTVEPIGDAVANNRVIARAAGYVLDRV